MKNAVVEKEIISLFNELQDKTKALKYWEVSLFIEQAHTLFKEQRESRLTSIEKTAEN